ncbi:hypothetical protein ACOMHN_007831 [Nucella lapillus]
MDEEELEIAGLLGGNEGDNSLGFRWCTWFDFLLTKSKKNKKFASERKRDKRGWNLAPLAPAYLECHIKSSVIWLRTRLCILVPPITSGSRPMCTETIPRTPVSVTSR